MKRHVLAAVVLSVLSPWASAQPFDAAAAWKAFTAHAQYGAVNDAYQLLGRLGYDGSGVDAAACSTSKDELDRALQSVPVGLALHHAALLCAEGTEDPQRADVELEALGALTRYALAGSGTGAWAPPLRIVRPEDVTAFVHAAGYEERYAYYADIQVNEGLPRTVQVFDREAGKEKELHFDWIAPLAELASDSEFRGYPIDRFAIAHRFLDAWTGNDAAAADVISMRDAWLKQDARAKRDRLKAGAARGGLLSTQGWMAVCSSAPFDGCADGLVDALLPMAEKGYALARAELALAYLQGIGVKADKAAAQTLLDSADRISESSDGAVLVAGTLSLRNQPWPGWLKERLEQAQSRSPAARALLIGRRVDEAKSMPVGEDRAFLEVPENNRTGHGLAMLARWATQLKSPEADSLLQRAAAAGDASSMRALAASRLASGDAGDATIGMLRTAAMRGDTTAARQLAYRDILAGDYAAARKWLLGNIVRADVDAMLMLAGLQEQDLPGVGTAQQAAEMYGTLADEVPASRRALAAMLLEGKGIAKDVERARRLLMQDAEQNDSASQLALARAYLQGSFGSSDPVSGERWLKKAAATGEGDARAAYASWLLSRPSGSDRARGMAMLRSAADAGSMAALNDLAWRLCVVQDPSIRDGTAGLAVAKRLGNPDLLPWGVRDTVAACYAAAGNFSEARRLQALAMNGLPPGKSFDATRERMKARLELYEAGKPYLESDPKQL